MCSATSDKNRADTGADTGAGGSGSVGLRLFDLLNNLLCDWDWWCVSGSCQGSSFFTSTC